MHSSRRSHNRGLSLRCKLRCLDAGCGTGLCGPLIATCVDHLIGVDLSANMLDQARRHNVYQELIKGELTEYLENHRCGV